MKTIQLFTMAALIAAFSFAGTVQEADAGKIGYVDLSRLFDEYHKTKEYDKVLEAKHNELEKVGQEKIEKIKESEGKLALLKDEEKRSLETQIASMKAEAQEFVTNEQTNLTKDRNEKIREILLEIEKVVSDFAEKEQYDIILNDRVLIYGSQTQDVTEQILAILNQPAS